MVSKEAKKYAKILWDYHHMGHEVKKADCIFVLGSHDIRVAERGAELYLQELAPLLIFAGGLGRLTTGIFTSPEAEVFADRAREMGVPDEAILTEEESTNTGENVQFTEKILKEKGLTPESFIVVQKPYMERRAYATIRVYWPEKELMVTSQQVSFEKYPNEDISLEDVINIMVGDLQRIMIYPEKGFQIEQEVPDDVLEAYEKLIELGYDKHLI